MFCAVFFSFVLLSLGKEGVGDFSIFVGAQIRNVKLLSIKSLAPAVSQVLPQALLNKLIRPVEDIVA